MSFRWQLANSRWRRVWPPLLLLTAFVLGVGLWGLSWQGFLPVTVVGLVLIHDFYRDASFGIREFAYRDGHWSVTRKTQRQFVSLKAWHLYGKGFGVLEFAGLDGKVLRVILWPDSLCADDFRQLRLALA